MIRALSDDNGDFLRRVERYPQERDQRERGEGGFRHISEVTRDVLAEIDRWQSGQAQGDLGVYFPQSISREQVFAALAACGIERDGASYAEYERAKKYLGNEWFADSVDYDQMIGFIEEFVGI